MEAPCVYWPDDGIVPTTTTTTTQRNIKIQKEEEEITIEQPQHIGDTERKLHEAA
jgi:hypothetical protein